MSLSLGVTTPGNAAVAGMLPPHSSHLGRGGSTAGVSWQFQPQRHSEPGGVRGGMASGLSHGAGTAAVTLVTESP